MKKERKNISVLISYLSNYYLTLQISPKLSLLNANEYYCFTV